MDDGVKHYVCEKCAYKEKACGKGDAAAREVDTSKEDILLASGEGHWVDVYFDPFYKAGN